MISWPEVQEQYVPFAKEYGDIALDEQDTSHWAIIGRLGSGKSMTLRRLHHYQEELDDIYTYPLDLETQLSYTSVLEVSLGHGEYEAPEIWRRLWLRALQRSVYTHLKRVRRLQGAPTFAEDMATLAQFEGHLLPKGFVEARSPDNQVASVIQSVKSGDDGEHINRARISSLLYDEGWQDVETILSRLLKHAPPIRVFIDSLNKEWDLAPAAWTFCQQGLLQLVMEQGTHKVIGKRFRVVSAFRDPALLALASQDNASKFLVKDRMAIMAWSEEALRLLVEKKIEALPPSYLADPSQSDPLHRWLGTSVVFNESRGVEEDLWDYLLRHSRQTPRDMVTFGNTICEKQERHGIELSAAEIRTSVREMARKAARSQLGFAASHAMAIAYSAKGLSMDDVEGALGTPSSNEPEVDEIRQQMRGAYDQVLRTLLRDVGSERLSTERALRLRDDARTRFAPNVNILDVLWQNGLIGYRPKAGATQADLFYVVRDVGTATFPIENAEACMLHPALLDDGIELQLSNSVVRPVYDWDRHP